MSILLRHIRMQISGEAVLQERGAEQLATNGLSLSAALDNSTRSHSDF